MAHNRINIILKKQYSRLIKFKKNNINQLRGNTDYKKFVIISRSRTGSTLLMALLNNHSEVICEGELFKNLNGLSCKIIWQNFFNKKPKIIKQVGFKLFYYHPFENDKQVWEFIKKEKDITIIHLVRNNLLRSFTSQKIGEKTKQWTENKNRPHEIDLLSKKIKLNYKDCLNTFEKIKRYEEITREDFKSFNFIEVSYEDLNSNRDEELNKIFNKLGLFNEKVGTVMKKQNPESLQVLIENFEELKIKFKNSKWEYLFDEG